MTDCEKSKDELIEQLNLVNGQLRNRINELSTLNNVVHAFNTATNVQEALEDVARYLTELFAAFSTYISLYNWEKFERRIVAGYDPHTPQAERLTGMVFDTQASKLTSQIAEGKIFFIDQPDFPSFLDTTAMPLMAKRQATSLLVVPVLTAKEVIGAISLTLVGENRSFTDDDLRMAEIIAVQVSSAFEKSRLYETAQQELAKRIASQTALEQARDQAIQASQVKTHILAKVSHELRTPLSVILGHVELIEKEIYGPITAEQHEAISEIKSSTHYLSAMVNDLLDQAKFEQDGISIEVSQCDLLAVVEQVGNNMAVLGRAKGLELTVVISEAMPAKIWGDAKRYQQILFNLLSNAIKYTEEGEIRLEIRPYDKQFWELIVTDTGIGIPAEGQRYIFDPFRQIDRSLSHEQLGAGLGLSIVKQLVDRLGGTIAVTSALGEGSTFTVRLPWRPEVEEG